jgi:hypothetical protein
MDTNNSPGMYTHTLHYDILGAVKTEIRSHELRIIRVDAKFMYVGIKRVIYPVYLYSENL